VTPYEEASVQIRAKVKEALVAYGQHRTSSGNTREVEKAADQSLNFFEALLVHHKPKPPFEDATLSEISPNKRVLFSSNAYADMISVGGHDYLGCRPTKLRGVHGVRVVFRRDCVRINILHHDDEDPERYSEMVALMEERNDDPFFHIDQLREPIPHALKDIRTNSQYYIVGEQGDYGPETDSAPNRRRVTLLTETVRDILRIFEGEVYLHIALGHATFYNQWFSVQLPRVKK